MYSTVTVFMALVAAVSAQGADKRQDLPSLSLPNLPSVPGIASVTRPSISSLTGLPSVTLTNNAGAGNGLTIANPATTLNPSIPDPAASLTGAVFDATHGTDMASSTGTNAAPAATADVQKLLVGGGAAAFAAFAAVL